MKGTIKLYLKHDDRVDFVFVNENSQTITKDHDGYMPKVNNLLGGDYTRFVIDNETGKILNWKPVTLADLASEDILLAEFDPEQS